ncbi:uncharacterized protein [Amphiura filiformis]|uniref:uncharacterized protein n=1 Tax=Amphiura filiformis TaxID=82378 RepID=UPI003B21C570
MAQNNLLITVILVSVLKGVVCIYPFQNTSLQWDERVDDVVGRLTLEELVLQIARGGGSQNGPAPAIERLGILPYQWSTECLRGDVGAGNATSFPQAIGLSATFSRELIFRMAEATGIEVRAKHTSYMADKNYVGHTGLSCFSPVINIMRHPLWGRNQETYGEDPYLSGELAKSYVRGLQGNHPRYIRANAGCKHFDVYAGPENIPESRMSFDAKVSDRDWQMTFLPQFRECVKAGTFNIMCSYNSVNGIPACVNKKLLTDILRTEFGFKGYVVSDETALEFVTLTHAYTKTFKETGILAVKAGCNLELTSFSWNNSMTTTLKSVESGDLTKEEIVNLAKPLFYTRMRLGEFDPPSMNPYMKLNLSNVQSEAHRALSIEIAAKTFVLLKNDGNLLPMTESLKKIAFVGPFADSYGELFGDYSATPDPQFTKTPRQGLMTLASSNTYASGCDNPKCKNYNATAVSDAINQADIVVMCLGTGTSVEAEGRDRSDIDLPGQQTTLLTDVVTKMQGKPVILLLFNAGPLNVTWAVSNAGVQVIMECFFPAQATGDALYRVFTNTNGANPAGRLPATWPASLSQVLPITNYTMKGRTYRYLEDEPLFPFGYGMSYTEFNYTNLAVSPSSFKPCDNVTVSVTLQNIGKLAGDEVIQVYINWTNASVPVPKSQLVDFNRTHLNPGQQATVQFQLVPRVMAVYTDQEVIEPGKINVFVGGQQPNQKVKLSSPVLNSSFVIQGQVTQLKSCKYPGWGN